jgi:U3 small nucleolar RNA-associated protein 10
MIPFVQSIIQCTLTMTTSATSSALAKQAFAVQSALVETVPTFLGSKQLNSILRSAFTYRAKDADVSKSLVSVVAKKIPTKTMFPVVMELWKGVQSEGQVALSGFFDLLRFVLRNADRQALPGMVKSIFAFFLDVFDLRHRLQQKGVEAEVSRGGELCESNLMLDLDCQHYRGLCHWIIPRIGDKAE